MEPEGIAAPGSPVQEWAIPEGMRRIGGLAVGAVLLGLLLALYAARLSPGEAPPAEPQAAPLPAPEPAVELRPAETAPPPPSAARLRAAPPGEPDRPALAAPLEPEPAPVPLEKLLTWEDSRPVPRGLELGKAAAPEAEPAPSEPGVRDRVYLERRTEEMAPGDRERKLETTDVGVRVPVAGSVEVRGGVRIESRQDGESEADESTPTVGVGVRF
jgi:hypothetical protein